MRRYWFIVMGLAALLGLVLGATSVASADPEPGTRVQVPVIDETTCETWVTIQNVGNIFSKAVLVTWGNPGPCQPQALGPNKVECTGLLKPGAAWTFTKDQMPSGAKSGIVYSFKAQNLDGTLADTNGNGVSDADEACEKFFGDAFNYKNWRNDDAAYRTNGNVPITSGFAVAGSPMAVEVDRKCPGDVTPGFNANAAYTGISESMEGAYDPVYGGFAYYVPLIWNQGQGGYNTTIWIQNSGDECTSVEIYFQQQDQCLHPVIGEILFLTPGETRAFNPGTIVNTPWQGSAWIRASQPLGIVVDVKGKDMFGSYRGFPSQLQYVFNGTPFYTPGAQVNYAPLIYREYNGWQTGIQVQNLSSIVNAKVKVYFVDNVGGVITTVVDWVCPRGSQTFFLPVINGLPGNYVGAARVESQDWFTPGDPKVLAPYVMSVVNVIKYADQNSTTTPLEMVMYNAVPEQEAFDWQVGYNNPPSNPPSGFQGIRMLGVPLVAKAKFNQVYSELAIQNINPNPGFTDFAIYFYDQNGLLDYVCEKLNEKQVEYIDLNSWGYIPSGFLGSVVIYGTYTSQPGGYGLGGVAIERIGRALTDPQINGDESKGYEMFPITGAFDFEGPEIPVCPGQPTGGNCVVTGQILNSVTGAPVVGALVRFYDFVNFITLGEKFPGETTTTDQAGNFVFSNPNLPLGPYIVTSQSAGSTELIVGTYLNAGCAPGGNNAGVFLTPNGGTATIGGVDYVETTAGTCTVNATETRNANFVWRLISVGLDATPGTADDAEVSRQTTDTFGTYLFKNISAGRYYLSVGGSTGGTPNSWLNSTAFDVTGGQVVSVNFKTPGFCGFGQP